MQVDQLELKDDGCVPNHPSYPLLMYHDVFLRDGSPPPPSEVIGIFESNDWHGAWVNGIFPFHHYHSCSHEVLANLGDPVEVQFGGSSGPVVTFPTGAVVVIPAGGGHCRLADVDKLVIVGAYPAGQESWDLKRADDPSHYAAAKDEIARVERPDCDPVTGNQSPLLDYWT